MSSSRSSSTDNQDRGVGARDVAARSWHALAIEDVARALNVDPACGLSAQEVIARRAALGPNAIHEGRTRGPAAMLLAQFTDFMIVVLVAAAIVAGMIGEPQDAISIVVIVVLNAIIGFVQEYRAEQAVAALKRIAAPTARVRRDGTVAEVAAVDLVPGDVVLLEAGNLVPADLRIVEAAQLRTDESALTGESQPVDKVTGALEPELPLAERRNVAFKGTLVTQGRGVALVVATGMTTELGRIAALLADGGTPQTPLQRRLAAFGRRLALVVLAICGVILAAGLLRGESPVLMFLTAVSLAVAAIPEALPAVVTVSLALGARKMVQKQALIRRLPAVETLGSVTCICSDKTGTLTRNRMRVEAVFAAGRLERLKGGLPAGAPWPLLFQVMALNNDAAFDRDGRAVGDPTETALLEAARDGGCDRGALMQAFPRMAELPFDSTRKRMSTLHRAASASESEGWIVYTKGAPEEVLACCSSQFGRDGIEALDKTAALATANTLAEAGHRVLGFALRHIDPPRECSVDDALERDLVFLGLIGLIDPARPEAAAAVEECRSAGIRPVMITGDHPATAGAIARELRILGGNDGEVVTGRELSRLDDATLAVRVHDIRVYARVDPGQKIRIVQALQTRGELVAMTGDGVNDAPALKRADIGVAMGKGGTDVAREAAAMVLLDDNFATIVAAVHEGRHIYDNIRKFVRFVMTGNSGEIWTLFLAPVLGLPMPLLPVQILWVNLVTDGLPGLALSVEPAEKGVMRRPPRPPRESVFAHGTWQHILWVGLLIGAVSILAQAWGYRGGSRGWQTMVFTTLAFSQLFHVLAIRSERDSLLTQGLLSNAPLLGAVVLSFALQFAIIYVPALQPIFRTVPLTATEVALCLGLSCVILVAVEIEKWLVRRGWIYAEALPQKSV